LVSFTTDDYPLHADPPTKVDGHGDRSKVSPVIEQQRASRGNSGIYNVAAEEFSMSDFAGLNVPEQLKTLGWNGERVSETRQKDLAIEQEELMKSSLDFD